MCPCTHFISRNQGRQGVKQPVSAPRVYKPQRLGSNWCHSDTKSLLYKNFEYSLSKWGVRRLQVRITPWFESLYLKNDGIFRALVEQLERIF